MQIEQNVKYMRVTRGKNTISVVHSPIYGGTKRENNAPGYRLTRNYA